jgi:hypothetical protein
MNSVYRILALTAALTAGCGPGLQAPADSGRAEQTLRTTLDAWQRGDTPESLRKATPPITVADVDWAGGYRLTGYQVQGAGDRSGVDLRFAVTLTLKDPKGKTVQKSTAYVVGTNPALTVVRNDPDS